MSWKQSKIWPQIFMIAIATVFSSQLSAQLNITMDYTAFQNSAPGGLSSILNNDSWTGGTTDTERLNAAIAVMDQAVADIESLFTNCTDVQINQTIAVGWASHGGNTLATGGASWNGSNQLTGGTLNWDNDGSSTFFTDLTPADHSEFSASANDLRTMEFSSNGIQVNVEDRYYANFLGTAAADNSDMYSVAVHEIMHALGVLDTYPLYSQLDLGSDGDLDLVADGTTYEVAYSGGHTTISLPWDGPGSLGGTYYPNVIGPSIVSGTRGQLTDIDALLLANIHGFGASDFSCVTQPHGTIQLNAIPEPNSLGVLVLGSLIYLTRRRRRVS